MTVCTGKGKRLHTLPSHPTLRFKLGNASNNISKHKPCALTTKPHLLTSLAENESAFVIRWTYNYDCFSFSYPTLASATEPVNPNIQSVGNMRSYIYIYIQREREISNRRGKTYLSIMVSLEYCPQDVLIFRTHH